MKVDSVRNLVASLLKERRLCSLGIEQQREISLAFRNLAPLISQSLSRSGRALSGGFCLGETRAIRKHLRQASRLIDRHLSLVQSRYQKNPVTWSDGYLLHRDAEIDRLTRARIEGTWSEQPFGAGLDERIVELPWVVHKVKGSPLILDAGSALNHAVVLKHLRDSKVYIVTLYPERYRDEDGVSYLYEDLRQLSFKDDLFDAVVSVSTIEHIALETRGYKGDAALRDTDTATGDHVSAVLEMKRVVKAGGRVLITAPFGRHQVHGGQWQIFDAAMVAEVVSAFAPRSYELRYYRYLDDRWQSASADECAGAVYRGNGSPAAGAVFLLELTK